MSEEKKGFFSRLKAGLTKTRENIVRGIDSLFSGFSAIDEDFYEELEEILIMADLGMATTEAVIEDLKEKVKERHIKDPAECKELLKESICEQMNVDKERLLSAERTREVAIARQIAMYLAKQLTKIPLTAIGLALGGRNHATVLHSCKTISNLMETDQSFKLQVEDLEKLVSA